MSSLLNSLVLSLTSAQVLASCEPITPTSWVHDMRGRAKIPYLLQIPEVGDEEKDIPILHYGAVDADNRWEAVL